MRSRQIRFLAQGLNVHRGQVTYEAVAKELGYDYVPVDQVLTNA